MCVNKYYEMQNRNFHTAIDVTFVGSQICALLNNNTNNFAFAAKLGPGVLSYT